MFTKRCSLGCLSVWNFLFFCVFPPRRGDERRGALGSVRVDEQFRNYLHSLNLRDML